MELLESSYVSLLNMWGLWSEVVVFGSLKVMPYRSIATFAAVLLFRAFIASGEEIKLASVPRPLPDGERFVFVWRGDLWLAGIDGSELRQLTRHAAVDHWPCVAPDGKQVAFTSKRDNTWQVYVMAIDGGEPRQITFNTEGGTPLVWFPDGKSVLMRAERDQAGANAVRLFRVAVDGSGDEELLFDAYAYDADISPDGKHILFTRDSVNLYRKGHRGSKASQIWHYCMSKKSFRCIRRDPGGSRSPLWRPDGKGFYFVGQESGCFNVWEQELESGEAKQLTHFTDASVIIPGLSRNGGCMVFRQLFDFYRIDPRRGRAPERIDLRAAVDLPREPVRRRWYEAVWNNNETGSVDFTDDGLQICFTSGGDLWVMDTVLREPRQVTSETVIHDREACFTPDGKAILLLRDDGCSVNIWRVSRRDGEHHWWRNREFDLTPLTTDEWTRYNLSVSPDGSNIAYCVQRGDVYVADANGSNAVRVAQSSHEAWYDWSPDGCWLACNLSERSGNRDIWIVSTRGEREPYNLSRHPNTDYSARWSPDGRIIAFVGRRYDDSTDLYYVYLSRDDDRESKRDRSLEKALGAMKAGDKKKDGNGDKNGNRPVRIDFDGLAERVRKIDVPGSAPSNPFWSFDSKALAFYAKVNGKSGTYKVVFPDHLKPEFMTDKRGEQAKWVKKDSKILWLVDRVPSAYTQKYPFKAFQHTDISDYRRLAIRVIWRTLRDRFYDPALNNLDWKAVLAKYEEAAATAADRAVFDKVVLMLLGELNSSHMAFSQSDTSKKEWGTEWHAKGWKVRTGHPGVRFDGAYEGDGLRVADVIPDGPADSAHSRLEPGDVVLRANGVAVADRADLTRALTGEYPRDDVLVVRGTNGTERAVTIRTVSYEDTRELLRDEEIRAARRRVDELSAGTLGYLHIAKMQWEDLRKFEQEVFAWGSGKDGLIIDVRGNTGGFVADRLLSILCHPMHAVTVPRDGEPSYPNGYLGKALWEKPITVLCDQRTASNGEIFSHAIKTLKRGKVVGVPTQGGVISTPKVSILDVGTLWVPERGWFVGETGQDMEMNGCVPHVVVWPEPGEIPRGVDRQLVAGVDALMKDVAAAKKAGPRKLTLESERRRGE